MSQSQRKTWTLLLDRRGQAESIPVPAAGLGPLAQKDSYTTVTYFEVAFFLFMLYMHLFCVPVCVCMHASVRCDAPVVVRDQLVVGSSFLPALGSRGLNSGGQAW